MFVAYFHFTDEIQSTNDYIVLGAVNPTDYNNYGKKKFIYK